MKPIRFLLALCVLTFGNTLGATLIGASDPFAEGVVLPPPDPVLQKRLDQLVRQAPFKKFARKKSLCVALLDVTDPQRIRFAAIQPDEMRYAASLPKIAIMLGVFDQVERRSLEYTPRLKEKLVRMIRVSSNRDASDLIKLVGFEAIEKALRNPKYQLYDPAHRGGGLWVGKDYGGELGYWKRDPLRRISHGATARQVARFLFMMESGQLISPWASREMKDIMSNPGIHHKFVRGLESARPGSEIYRKSGTWKEWHADAALVERDGKKYIAVAMLRSKTKGVLSRLIVHLDDLIFQPQPARAD